MQSTMVALKTVVVPALLATGAYSAVVDSVTEQVVALDGSAMAQVMASTSTVSYSENSGLQVIHNFLNDEEIAYFNGQADKVAASAAQRDSLAARRGFLSHDAVLSPELVHRFDCVWNDQRCAQGPPKHSVVARVSHLEQSMPAHQDHLGRHVNHGLTAIVPLRSTTVPMELGQGTEVTLQEGSLVVFHSNATHSLMLPEGEEARFLGPFELEGFQAVGINGGATCEGCTLSCNSQTTITGNCDVVVSILCNGPWDGSLCFECDAADEFNFGFGDTTTVTVGRRQLQATEGSAIATPFGTCRLPTTPQALDFYQLECTDIQGNTAFITVSEPAATTTPVLSAKASKATPGGITVGRNPVTAKTPKTPTRFRGLNSLNEFGEEEEEEEEEGVPRRSLRNARAAKSTKAPLTGPIEPETCNIPSVPEP